MGLIRATFSSSPTLNSITNVNQMRCAVARTIDICIQHFGVKTISAKTGIPAKDLHRYAKGALINKGNFNRLGKFFENVREWKQQPVQITGDTSITQCFATNNE